MCKHEIAGFYTKHFVHSSKERKEASVSRSELALLREATTYAVDHAHIKSLHMLITSEQVRHFLLEVYVTL